MGCSIASMVDLTDNIAVNDERQHSPGDLRGGRNGHSPVRACEVEVVQAERADREAKDAADQPEDSPDDRGRVEALFR